MSDPKLFEFVCTGNHGRSPVAELIARAYLKAHTGYDSISSGTVSDQIEAGNVVAAGKIRVIRPGLERGIYDAAQRKAADEAIRSGNEEQLEVFYQMAIDIFAKEERDWRGEALKKFSIEVIRHGLGKIGIYIRKFQMGRRNSGKITQGCSCL